MSEPLRTLHLRNFTVFKETSFEFCPGVNVLLGKNGSGKSQSLKAAYALIQAQLAAAPRAAADVRAEITLGIKPYLEAVFQVKHESRLRRRSGGEGPTVIRLDFGGEFRIHYWFTAGGSSSRLIEEYHPTTSAVFLPPREVLSMFPRFTTLWEKYELPFDRTYFDLCKALDRPLLRQAPPIFQTILASLEQSIGGRIELRGSEFVLRRGDGELEVSLMAEGHRKLATVLYLLLNESLVPGGYLFWDEPEANMNPALVVVLKDLLLGLARAGVQVFLATHDFLLTRELSLAAEYRRADPEVRFFCLDLEQQGEPIKLASGATLSDLQSNPIVAEYAAHYEREAQLFASPEGK